MRPPFGARSGHYQWVSLSGAGVVVLPQPLMAVWLVPWVVMVAAMATAVAVVPVVERATRATEAQLLAEAQLRYLAE